jgi:hypothetical protein
VPFLGWRLRSHAQVKIAPTRPERESDSATVTIMSRHFSSGSRFCGHDHCAAARNNVLQSCSARTHDETFRVDGDILVDNPHLFFAYGPIGITVTPVTHSQNTVFLSTESI